MNARRATPWVICALLFAGVTGMGLRRHAEHQLQLTHGDTLWRLTYDVDFRAEKSTARVRVAFPNDAKTCRVFRQDVSYAGMRAERLRPSALPSRELGFAASRGEHNFSARFDIHLSPRARFRSSASDTTLTADARAELLHGTPALQTSDPAVVQTLQKLRAGAGKNGNFVQKVFEHCRSELEPGDPALPQDAAAVLQRGTATPLGRVRAFVALCRAAKIPARLVTGFEVKEALQAQPHTWAEIFSDKAWEPFDPENGFAGEIPHTFLAVRHDGGDVVRTTGAKQVHTGYSIVRLPSGLGAYRAAHRSLLGIVDLTRLPLEMHEAMMLILLLPLGGLMTAIFRTIIGIRTFGTFTPTLIALSFIFADWRTGIVVFLAVLALGLVSRSFLDRLKLLMVPRLSIVLTLVVLLICLSVSLLDYIHLTPSAQAVLLPMVILTMTIERFYLASEEDSVRFALQLLTGTVVVGVCCYLILRWGAVGRMLLAYPEMHFFTIAVLILIGRYTGYRLTELFRFRDFLATKPGPDSPPP